MIFSKKILNLSQSPVFIGDLGFEHQVSINLSHNKSKLRISFETIEINDEVCFNSICYQTDLCGPYLGLFDGFVALMHKRPIEAIDRFPAKELDYYLRDESSVASVSGLDEKFYEILGVGEELKKSYFKIEIDNSPKLNQSFFSMSLSEQLELIEEIFSYYIYNTDSELSKLEVIDVEDNIIYFKGEDPNLTQEVELFLRSILACECSVNIKTDY